MKKSFSRLYVGLIFLFLYTPIVVLMVFSFNDSKSRTVWAGFTTRWYTELFSDKLIISSLYTTITVAVLCAVISTILGTMAAIGINNMRRIPKQSLLTLNNIPATNPDIITGVSLMLLFLFFGNILTFVKDWLYAIGVLSQKPEAFQLGFGTLLLAHITFCIPYVILSVMPKLRQLDKNLYEAALDLGAKPLYAFRKVIFPEIMPGVITGMIMAFTLSIDDFAVSYFTTGSKSQTLAMTIYSMTRKRVSPKINALSTIMFLSVLILLIIVNVRQIRDMQKSEQKSID